MKAYTSLSQSITLGKFLPIESADGFYESILNPTTKEWDDILVTGTEWASPEVVIPAWSLAALLSVLPKNLNIGRPSLESNYEGCYWIQYYDEFMKPNNYKTKCYDNPINACYEMITRLHELNLL